MIIPIIIKHHDRHHIWYHDSHELSNHDPDPTDPFAY